MQEQIETLLRTQTETPTQQLNLQHEAMRALKARLDSLDGEILP